MSGDYRGEAGAVVHQSWDAGRRELAETHCGNLVRERSTLGLAGDRQKFAKTPS